MNNDDKTVVSKSITYIITHSLFYMSLPILYGILLWFYIENKIGFAINLLPIIVIEILLLRNVLKRLKDCRPYLVFDTNVFVIKERRRTARSYFYKNISFVLNTSIKVPYQTPFMYSYLIIKSKEKNEELERINLNKFNTDPDKIQRLVEQFVKLSPEKSVTLN